MARLDIEISRGGRNRNVDDLDCGDIFEYGDDLYIKADFNCVELKTGRITTFSKDAVPNTDFEATIKIVGR